VIVYVYPADTTACGSVRLIWPAAALRAAGHDVRVVLPQQRAGIGGDIDTKTNQLKNVIIPPDADVIVLQRVAFAHMAQAVPMIRARGVAVVVDMDDDLTKIDPSNPAFWALRTDGVGRMAHHNYRNAHAACLTATLVTLSTPALLKVYAPHGRGVVIENRIPAGYLDIEHVDSATLGWPGSVHSHPADLHQLGPAVQRLVHEGATYRGVGPDYADVPGDGALRRALGLAQDPPVTGAVDMSEYPRRVAEIGVGLAPLAQTAFNSAKSWLKPLEMMACGVPFVAQNFEEYRRLMLYAGLIGHGVANTPKDWYRKLKALVLSQPLREEISETGRDFASRMTIEGNAWHWWEAWAAAFDLQKGRAVTGLGVP
jgi:glycosyltransferase involved in cell wall biosynthesis